MPLQNRVDPFGAIIRTEARGTMMGNRGGALHNCKREIVRTYKSRRWIACVLEFRGRQRTVMSEGRYTELFFLDEAVAFAAGHRPCAECRRQQFNAFKEAWPRKAGQNPIRSIDEIDIELHRARIDCCGNKVTYRAPVNALPDGAFIEIDGQAYLLWRNALLLWTPEGYKSTYTAARDSIVTVLTPEPLVECFRRGYLPDTHDSCRALIAVA